MKKGGSSPASSTSRLPAPEALEIARTFEENPVDGSALLRLCAHHLAAGDRARIQEALATHLSAASGGSKAVRLRLAQAGELLPEQRAELLVDLSHVELEQIGDAPGALASAREALTTAPSSSSARLRFEELARGEDPTEMALDDRQLLDALEDDAVTDPSFRPPTLSPKEAWASAGETPSDVDATIKIPVLSRESRPKAEASSSQGEAAEEKRPADHPSSSRAAPYVAGEALEEKRAAEAKTPHPSKAAPERRREDLEADEGDTDPGLSEPRNAPLADDPSNRDRAPFSPYDPDPALRRQCESLAERADEIALGALAALERSCERDVDRAVVHEVTSKVHEAMGHRDRAFSSLALAARLTPPDRGLLDELFRLAVMTGSYADLAAAYQDTLEFSLTKPDRIYVHLKLGHLNARELSRPKEAIEQYRKVTALDPHNVEALRRLGELLAREERWSEVAEVKQRELETVWLTNRDLGRAATVKKELAGLYEERLQDRRKAMKLYRELLKITPGNPAAIASLERMSQADADDETTRQAFETLRDQYEREGAHNRLADLLSNTARDLAKRGRLLDAVALHREAAKTHETHLEDPGRAFIELVRAVQMLPQGEDAEREGLNPSAVAESTDTVFDDLLRTGRAARTHEQLMTIGEDLALRMGGSMGASILVRLVDAELEDLGDAARAASRLARAVELSGNDPALEARLEGLYVSRGSWSDLSGFYRERAKRLTDTKAKSDLLFRLAEIQEDELGDVEGAAEIYEEIIQLDGNPDALAALCRLLEEGRRWRALVDALERAVASADNIENKKAALLKRAKVYLEKLQNPTAARADWKRVLAIDPQSVDALQGMAETISESGDAREAASALEESLSSMRIGEAGRADGYRRLARLYGDVLEQPSRARLAWEEVLEELPDDDEAFERLRTMYRERGDLEPLAGLLGARLEKRPHDPDARNQRRERIDALEKLGRGEEAGREWWYAAQADPTDLEAHARLTAFHTARRNWKVVVRVLEDWLAATTSATEKADIYYRLAEVHRHQFEDEETAVAAYEKALARAPEHAGSQSALLEIYYEKGEHARMLPLLESKLRWATESRERTQALAQLWEVGSRLGGEGNEAAAGRGLAALKEACLLAPEDAGLWESLASALSSRDQHMDLAGHLEARAARQEGAERAVSLLEAAEALRAAGALDEERSKERLRRCLERARDAAPAGHEVLRNVLFQLREMYTTSGAWEALVGVLEQLALPETTTAPEERKPILDELAWLLAERVDRPLEAVEKLEQLLELSSSDEAEQDNVLGRLIALHGGIGDWHRVLALIEERIRLHRGKDREADLHLAAADISERRVSNPDGALGHLRAALAVRPGDEVTLARLERVCRNAGRFGDHASILGEEARRTEDPRLSAELLLRSAALKEERLNDPAGARRDLETALSSSALPSDVREKVQNALARTLCALGAFEDLTKLYEELMEAAEEAEVRADLSMALGLIHEEQRKDEKSALTVYRKALDADPSSTAALDAVARLAEKEGDLDTALEMRLRQAEEAWLSEQRAALLSDAARIHERKGQLSEALDCYDRAGTIDKQSSAALRGRLRLLRELGRGDEALKTARSLAEVAEEPKEVAALWVAVGEGLEEAGDDKESLEAYQRALSAVPHHGHASAALARVKLGQGRPAEALSLLDQAAEALERESDNESLADVHRLAASACETLGRSEDARRRLHEAYRLRPTRRTTLEALAFHFSSREDALRTHEILCTLLEHHEEDLTRSEKVSLLRRIGLSLAAMDRSGDAARKLDEALSLAPRDRDVMVALAGIYETTGRWAEVVDIKKKLLALSRSKKDKRRLSLEIADLFAHHLHDAKNAARILSQALDTHPDDPEILARLAEEHEKRGAYDEAATCLERIVGTAREGGPPKLWVKLGRLRQERLNAPVRALLAYRTALETAGEPADVEEALSAVRDLVATTRDARPLAELLATLADKGGAPGVSQVSLLREIAEVRRYQLGDRAGAIEALEKAVEIDPDDMTAVEELARLYEREGRDDEAMQTLRRVLHVSPFEVDAYRALLRVLKRQGEDDGVALIASLLVLMEEADEETASLAWSLGRPPAGGRVLPKGCSTPGLVHPDATGPLDDLLQSLGTRALGPFATGFFGAKDRPMTDESGPYADRSATAIMLAARAFDLPEPEIHLGPADMQVPIAPAAASAPRILVSPKLVDGSQALTTAALKFQAGRAVLSTRPSFVAPRVLSTDKVQALIDAALVLLGLEADPGRDASRLAKKLERSIEARHRGEIERAAKEYLSGGRQDLHTYSEGVLHTVIRGGLLLSGNPEVVIRILREENGANRTTVRELVRFTISDEHLALRRALGWGVSVG